MKILYGMQRPDEGTIRVDGREVHASRPRRRHRRRHRHGAPALHARRQPHRARERRPRQRAAQRPASCSTSAPPGAGSPRSPTPTASASTPTRLVEDLGVGERQRVEILKVLYRGARILILDEPTAVLVPQEVDELFDNLRELKARGPDRDVHLAQARRGARRSPTTITVIRARHHRRRRSTRATSTARAARRADGRQRAARRRRPASRRSPTSEVLRVEGLTVRDAGRPRRRRRRLVHHPPRRDRSASPASRATARPSWSRRSSACAAPSRAASSLARRGHQPAGPPGGAARAGVGYIPEDRHRHGLLLDAPLWENRDARPPDRAGPTSRGPWIDRGGRPAPTPTRIVEEYDVRTPGIDVLASALSGGNQQKLIVGREMSGDADAAHRRATRPAASTSARRPRSGTTCATPAARAWPCCSSPPTSTS